MAEVLVSVPSSAEPPADRLSPVAVLAGALAVASLVALLDASRSYVANALIGRPTAWLAGLTSAGPSWIIAGLLAPLPLAFAHRLPIDRSRWFMTVSVHAAGAVLFAAAHVVAVSLYMSWQSPGLSAFGGALSKTSSLFVADLVLYAAIVGGAHALRFYREARQRELAASQLQAHLTEARLAVLRGQLDPHFLFNTLNAISTMALDGQMDRVVRTLGYLGDLLRVSLDDARPQEVTLNEELDLLERYLDIQRTRLGDRLTVRPEIDPVARQAMVPSMILQPLVENAITHGIAPTPGPGTIAIRATRRGDSLCLDVTDTGPGFAPTSSRADGPGDHRPPPGRGIGLANTRARLAQLYGAHQAVAVGTGDVGGARVSITLPFRLAPVGGPPA